MLPDDFAQNALDNLVQALLRGCAGALLLLLIGLLWAPFAAVICALTALKRKLPVGQLAWAGAGHAMLFLIPSLYVVAWIFTGRMAPRPIVLGGHAILYAIWACWITLYIMAGFYSLNFAGFFGLVSLIPMFSIAGFNLFYLWKSIKDSNHIRQDIVQSELGNFMLSDEHIRPFRRFLIGTLSALPLVGLWFLANTSWG